MVGDLADLGSDAGKTAEEGELLDDAGVAAGVARSRRGRLQSDQRPGAADDLEHVGPAQFVGHSDRVGRVTTGEQAADGVEHMAVSGLVEVASVHDLDGGDDRVLGQQHRPEQ